MRLEFKKQAYKDIKYWEKHNKKILKKIRDLCNSILKTPFKGMGKPEPLKHNYTGFWSRRIDNKNRLIYKIEKERILILNCRFHYK